MSHYIPVTSDLMHMKHALDSLVSAEKSLANVKIAAGGGAKIAIIRTQIQELTESLASSFGWECTINIEPGGGI